MSSQQENYMSERIGQDYARALQACGELQPLLLGAELLRLLLSLTQTPQ